MPNRTVPAQGEPEREEFLAEPHVGVLGVTDSRKASAPLLLPIWYCYLPNSSLPDSSAHRGEIVVETARTSVKADLRRSAGRFSLCAQTETEPYRYVSVEGPIAAVDDPVDPDVRAAMARRYLEPETAEAYLASTAGSSPTTSCSGCGPSTGGRPTSRRSPGVSTDPIGAASLFTGTAPERIQQFRIPGY